MLEAYFTKLGHCALSSYGFPLKFAMCNKNLAKRSKLYLLWVALVIKYRNDALGIMGMACIWSLNCILILAI